MSWGTSGMGMEASTLITSSGVEISSSGGRTRRPVANLLVSTQREEEWSRGQDSMKGGAEVRRISHWGKIIGRVWKQGLTRHNWLSL